MCYGANNNFHFDSLKNKIALLNGKNAMGKSSFLDILCIALYGEPTKMRNLVTGKKYTDKIIHDQRPVNKIAPFVRLMFRVGKDVYEIFRSFGTQAGKNKEHLILQTNVQICKVTVSFDDVYKEILCEGSTLVDKWISETIGSMDSVLLSTMICQIDLNNFFHLKQDDQKNILDKALRLDTVSIYGRILKESILAHQDILQQIKTAQHTVSNVIGNEEICIHKDVIDSKLQKICEELEKQDQLRDIWKTRIKHYEEVIPDNIEELYQESEINYRSLGKEITQEQIEQNIRLQERWKHLLETYETVKDFEILKDAPKQLEKWQKKLAKFLPKEPKCDVSMQWMDQMLEKYKEWKENNHEEYDLHRIETQYLEAEKNIFSCTKIEKPYRPRYIDIETLEGEVDITPFKSHYQELLANIPKTTRTLEEYNTWRKEYEEWKEMTLTVKDVELEELEQKIQKTQEKIDTYEEKETELKDIREEIETLEKDLESLKDMEFNPDCWACKKNPFQKKKEEYSTHYQELKDYSKQLSTYVRKIGHGDLITKWKEKLSSYKQQVLLYIEYHDKVESYLEEEQFWNKVLTQWEAYTVWQKEVEVVKQKLELYEKQEHNLLWNKYESQEEEHARKKGLYQEAKNKYAIAKKWKEESDYWYEILQEIEKHKDVYQLYTIWCEEKQILQTHLDKYTQSIERSKVEKEMEIVKEEYDRISDAVFIYVEYEKNSSLYYQSKLKELEIEYRKNLHEKETLLAEKTKIETQQEMMQRQKDSMEELMELEKIYTERIASIKKLDTLFIGDKTQSDGYKEWIYKQQVLPLLNREMNQFLQMFENFSFEMTYDKKHFIYMIHDRGNSPTLDKASGYQNFIIGLALRIILARIGAVGQQIKHMFIDEGFTACDSINIEKVPLLLESILKYGDYHSLLIMSHLDSVRECSHINIDIQRKDPFSYIQYGLEYPEIHIYDSKTGSIITKPKRGRPKKNMV
jgi:DNA repair exonuclease SbcCD ATPase subunit